MIFHKIYTQCIPRDGGSGELIIIIIIMFVVVFYTHINRLNVMNTQTKTEKKCKKKQTKKKTRSPIIPHPPEGFSSILIRLYSYHHHHHHNIYIFFAKCRNYEWCIIFIREFFVFCFSSLLIHFFHSNIMAHFPFFGSLLSLCVCVYDGDCCGGYLMAINYR